MRGARGALGVVEHWIGYRSGGGTGKKRSGKIASLANVKYLSGIF